MYAFDGSQRNAKYRAIGRNLLETAKLLQVSTKDANALNAKIREIGHLTSGQRLRVINNVSRLKEAAKDFGHFTPPDDLNELDAQTVLASAVYFALANTRQWSDLTADMREKIQQTLLYQLPDNAFGKGDFPLATTYGVEIEYYGLSAEQYRFVSEMADKLNTGWLASKDSTIEPDDGTNSMELISPICHQGDILDIYYAALVLEAIGGKTNKSCAFHVHAGIENTFDQSAHEALCKQILINYLEVERELSVLDSGLVRQYSAAGYEDKAYREEIEQFQQQILHMPMEQETLYEHPLNAFGRRRSKVNFAPLATYGTIEFRHHPGTVNPTEIMAWVKFIDGLIKVSYEMIDRGEREPRPPNQLYKGKLGYLIERFLEDRMLRAASSPESKNRPAASAPGLQPL